MKQFKMFKLEGLAREVPIVEDLSNTERAQLRVLAEPGGPLWKIMRMMTDYTDGLKDSLLGTNFLIAEEVQKAQQVQAAILAQVWAEAIFEVALTDVEEEENK